MHKIDKNDDRCRTIQIVTQSYVCAGIGEINPKTDIKLSHCYGEFPCIRNQGQ